MTSSTDTAAQHLATGPDQLNPSSSGGTPALTSSAAAQGEATADHDAERRQPSSTSTAAAELSRTKISLLAALRRFPDFPIKGINFIDILPIFKDVAVHGALLRALELQVQQFPAAANGKPPIKPDVVVGLDARGFLFGPSLALRLNAGFVPVRKKGKMPGPCETASYEKEYGTDYFQMQEDAIKPGQKVLIVDDIIATGEITVSPISHPACLLCIASIPYQCVLISDCGRNYGKFVPDRRSGRPLVSPSTSARPFPTTHTSTIIAKLPHPGAVRKSEEREYSRKLAVPAYCLGNW
jgi:adenine phosphoribosyltransferase